MSLHFMPGMAKHVRKLDGLSKSDMEAGADRVRAASAGLHPGMSRWADWAKGRTIGGLVRGTSYVGEAAGVRSFLAGVMLCRMAGSRVLTGRYAYAEALYARHVIEGRLLAGDNRPLYDACLETMGCRPGNDGPNCTIPLHVYLRFASKLGRRWDLVNQTVEGGLVRVARVHLTRLLRDSITSYIQSRIERSPKSGVEVPEDILKGCTVDAKGATGDVPPCVAKCVSDMANGVNVSHAGRFLTATLFLARGESDENVCGLFRGAPDYNEGITRTQVTQIRRRAYAVPSCGWVRSNSLCPGCDAGHPSDYRSPNP